MKWIQDYVEREAGVARKRVQDAESAIMQALEDIINAEQEPSITRKPAKSLQGMLYAIRESLSNLASSDDEEDE